MKTFNEQQMSDPWTWCRDTLDKHDISSRMLAEGTGAPRSTIRSLYNGANNNPRYDLLCSIIGMCIKLENGEMPFLQRQPKVEEKLVPTQLPVSQVEIDAVEAELKTEYDFL